MPATIMEGRLKGNVSTWIAWQLGDGEALSEHTLAGLGLDPENTECQVAKHFFLDPRPGTVQLRTQREGRPAWLRFAVWSHSETKVLILVLFKQGAARHFVLRLTPGLTRTLADYQTASSVLLSRLPDATAQGTPSLVDAPAPIGSSLKVGD